MTAGSTMSETVQEPSLYTGLFKVRWRNVNALPALQQSLISSSPDSEGG